MIKTLVKKYFNCLMVSCALIFSFAFSFGFALSALAMKGTPVGIFYNALSKSRAILCLTQEEKRDLTVLEQEEYHHYLEDMERAREALDENSLAGCLFSKIMAQDMKRTKELADKKV